MNVNEKVKNAMNEVVQAFENEDLESVSLAVFRGMGKPSDSWSFLNRLVMILNNTNDARGFKQWKQVNRYVIKGAKAFHILVPMQKKVPKKIVKVNNEREEEEETININIITGFKAVPVFRYEDTEGEPLQEEDNTYEIPYELNGIIEELGLTVSKDGFRGAYGWYSPHKKSITLASSEMLVFLHELAHAVDDKFHNLNGGQDPMEEVVAEFSAVILCYLMGYQPHMGHAKHYIQSYGYEKLFKCFNRVEKIVSYVIERTQTQNTQNQEAVKAEV